MTTNTNPTPATDSPDDAPVTRQEVLDLARACVTHPGGGHGRRYFDALMRYMAQEDLSPEEVFALNEEADRYAHDRNVAEQQGG